MADGADTGALYRPSGQKGHGIIAVPIGIALALLLSIPYGYISVYNPMVGKISFLIPCLYGLSLGLILGAVGKRAKCRSLSLARCNGAICSVFAVYFGWAAFIYAFISRFFPAAAAAKLNLWDVYSDPALICKVANAINASGWFTFDGSTPSGIILLSFWIAEAAIIIWATTFFAGDWIKETVFCEICNDWCKTTTDIARFATTADPPIIAAFKSGDLTPLARLGGARSGDPIYLRVDAQRCASCRETAAVSVLQVAAGKDEKGHDQLRTTKIVQLVMMPQDLLDGFQKAATQVAQSVRQQELAEESNREQRLKTGDLKSHERQELFRKAFLTVDTTIKTRSGFSFDEKSGRGCGVSVVAIALAAICSIALMNNPVGAVLAMIFLIAAVLATLYTIYLLHTDKKRYIKREIEPSLARTLLPLQPTQVEIVNALAEAQTLGYAVGELADARRIYAHIERLRTPDQ